MTDQNHTAPEVVVVASEQYRSGIITDICFLSRCATAAVADSASGPSSGLPGWFASIAAERSWGLDDVHLALGRAWTGHGAGPAIWALTKRDLVIAVVEDYSGFREVDVFVDARGSHDDPGGRLRSAVTAWAEATGRDDAKVGEALHELQGHRIGEAADAALRSAQLERIWPAEVHVETFDVGDAAIYCAEPD